MKTIFILGLGLVMFSKNAIPSDAKHPNIPYYIVDAAENFQVDPVLMYAICKVESNCRPKAINHDDGTKAQKQAGIVDKSYGLFQIKASTAKGLGFVVYENTTVEKVKKGKVIKVKKVINHMPDLLKPEINAWYAAKLIKQLYKRYGKNTVKVISAYNAGRCTDVNEAYVSKVLKNFTRAKVDKKF